MASCPQCNNEVSEGSQICVHCGAKFDALNGSPNDNQGRDETSDKSVINPGNTNSTNNPAKLNPSNSKGTDADIESNYKIDLTSDINRDGNESVSEKLASIDLKIDEAPAADETSEEKDISAASSSNDTRNSQEPTTSRSKWLDEQEKIKRELEALKGKISKDFKVETDIEVDTEEEIFTLDNNNFKDIKDASISLTTLKRPLTPEEEEKRDELFNEIQDLKKEGYDVSRLERSIDIDPTGAWQEFVKFMDDIETLQKLRKRYSELDTTGFEEESQSIRNKLDNPDLIHQIERELDNLEEKISQAAAVGDSGGLKELIAAGKKAFKVNEYEKALNFYKSALKIDPNNREVEFYRKKTEAKLQALSTMKGVAPAPAQASHEPEPAPTSAPAPAQAPKAPKPKAPAPASPMKMKPVGKPSPGIKTVSPKIRVHGKAAPPKTTIPTGANADVKKPLSVSMTPKLPTQKAAPKSAPAGPVAKKAKPKRIAVKKPVPSGPKAAPKPKAPAPETKPLPSNPAEVEALGFNAFINKDYQKALEYYEQVLSMDPNFPGAAAQRDKCKEMLGK